MRAKSRKGKKLTKNVKAATKLRASARREQSTVCVCDMIFASRRLLALAVLVGQAAHAFRALPPALAPGGRRLAVARRCASAQPAALRMAEAAGGEGGIREPNANEPIVPPVSQDAIRNLLPMADADLDSVRDFVQEFVVDPSRERTEDKRASVGKDGVVNIPVNADTDPFELGPVVQPKISMIFTCCRCETRQMRSFTRLAYEKGIVIVKCRGCGVRHLIADNLGWYYDWLEEGDTNVQVCFCRQHTLCLHRGLALGSR